MPSKKKTAKRPSAVAKKTKTKVDVLTKKDRVEIDKKLGKNWIDKLVGDNPSLLPKQDKQDKKAKELDTLKAKITEAFDIKPVLKGRDERVPKLVSTDEDDILFEPSKPISRNKKNAEKEDAFRKVFSEMFPTLNSQVKEAEEVMKNRGDPRDRKPKNAGRRNVFESEMSILQQLVSDLHRLLQFYLQAGRYENVVEYAQLIVSFAQKANNAKPQIGKKVAQPVPGTGRPGVPRSEHVIANEAALDSIVIKGKIADLLSGR